MKLKYVEKEILLGVLHNVMEGTAYQKFDRVRKSKIRFIATIRIKHELRKQMIDWSYSEIRRAYDRLCDIGLCERKKQGLYVRYSLSTLNGHTKRGDWFITDWN